MAYVHSISFLLVSVCMVLRSNLLQKKNPLQLLNLWSVIFFMLRNSLTLLNGELLTRLAFTTCPLPSRLTNPLTVFALGDENPVKSSWKSISWVTHERVCGALEILSYSLNLLHNLCLQQHDVQAYLSLLYMMPTWNDHTVSNARNYTSAWPK